MTWTYAGAPGTATADERRDAVRLLLGDTDTNAQQVTDEEIAFGLTQEADDVYRAAASMATALSGKYARMVDTAFEGVRSSYSQRSSQYRLLAVQLRNKAALSGGLGTPAAGGILISVIDAVHDDTDRVPSVFRRGQFRNPPYNTDEELLSNE